MAVSERTFGVEIECTYGSAPEKVNDVYGGHERRGAMRDRATKEIAASADFKRWAENIGIDGSGIEIRSPVLKGEEGIEELEAFFNFLVEKGSSVTNQDGMHVHHGAADLERDWKKLYAVCAEWGRWTPTIHSMVAKRRRNGGMCRDAFNDEKLLTEFRAVCLADKEAIAKAQVEYQQAMERYRRAVRAGRWPDPPRAFGVGHPSRFGGRGALNLANLQRQGFNTIEIRLAEGMMDAKCATAWVKFGQAFIDNAGDGIKATAQTLNQLLKAVRLDEEAAAILKAKAKNRGDALVAPAPGKVADGVHYDEEVDEF